MEVQRIEESINRLTNVILYTICISVGVYLLSFLPIKKIGRYLARTFIFEKLKEERRDPYENLFSFKTLFEVIFNPINIDKFITFYYSKKNKSSSKHNTEVPRPEVPRPEVPRPEVPRPEVPRREVSKEDLYFTASVESKNTNIDYIIGVFKVKDIFPNIYQFSTSIMLSNETKSLFFPYQNFILKDNDYICKVKNIISKIFQNSLKKWISMEKNLKYKDCMEDKNEKFFTKYLVIYLHMIEILYEDISEKTFKEINRDYICDFDSKMKISFSCLEHFFTEPEKVEKISPSDE